LLWLGSLLVATIGGQPAALAQKSADTLRVTWRDAIHDVDPYYNQLRTGLVLAHQSWDTLIDRDPDTFLLKPLLAASWHMVDDTTIDFELRRGVTFHNGDPFTADDVVYTIETVLADPNVAVPSNFAWLAGAEKLDDAHVRVKLKRVFPAALEYIAMTLPIWPHAYRARIGAAAYAQAPVGTGPYRITRIDGTSEIDLERFDGYFGGPKGKPAIRNLVIREVADTAGEVADLLEGRTDWIWNFSPDQFAAIDRVPALHALRAESMRVAYLSLDAAGRTGAGNPLTDPRVRQAIAYAIDRTAMARQLVQGASRVLDAPCYPTQFGCDASAATRYEYDPAKARQLLAAAGYGDGFATELVSYTLPQWGSAVQAYLKAVGITLRVSQLGADAAVQRALDGQTPMFLGSWGSYSINDVSAILPVFFGGGPNDYARDPELERLVDRGGATIDPDKRRIAYSAFIRRETAAADWLPLFTSVTNYATTRQLAFKPSPDEIPRFFLCSWN
jgi:peptide/nickel transport system substrate-binding protein